MGVSWIGLSRMSAAFLASIKMFLVKGSRSIVMSDDSLLMFVIDLMMACVCKCGMCIGSWCSDEDVMFKLFVNASSMGVLAACIIKCVELVSLHGILVFGRYNESNCKWHIHGTPITA